MFFNINASSRYKKSDKQLLFNLMSRLIVPSNDDGSSRGRGERPRDPSLAGKLKHSVIIFISRAIRAVRRGRAAREGNKNSLIYEVIKIFLVF